MKYTGQLFPKPKSEPRIKRAHFTDVGQCDGAGIGATYECKRCGYKSGWLFGLTKTEIKRGIECPQCNNQNTKITAGE